MTNTSPDFRPLPPPPRIVQGGVWRGLRPDDWALLPFFSLVPFWVTAYILYLFLTHQDLANDKSHLSNIGAIAFEFLLLLCAAFFWRGITRRISAFRRLCRDGTAVPGVIVSKRIHTRPRRSIFDNGRQHFRITYLFTNPHTNEPAQLEAEAPKALWQALTPGQWLHVLVEPTPGRAVAIYEFCPFTVQLGGTASWA